MQQERLFGADALLTASRARANHVVEQPHPLVELRLNASPRCGPTCRSRFRLLEQLGVGAAHQLAHDGREARQEPGLDAEPRPWTIARRITRRST